MNWSKLVQKNLIVESNNNINKDKDNSESVNKLEGLNDNEINISNEDIYEYTIKPHIFDEFYDLYIEDKELYGRLNMNDLLQFFESNLNLSNIKNIIEEDDDLELDE
jgi:hypothetical protein